MAVIFISGKSKQSRQELAERLAERLGCECLGREDLLADAAREGIAVERLQAAITKSPAVSERLARHRDLYRAFAIGMLCERASGGNLVYHGRAGHLLLQGIPHILKVRLVVDRETRVEEAMEELRIDRGKAVRRVERVDEDIRKWVAHFHGTDIRDEAQYNIVVNLADMTLSNACETIIHMAELPGFALDETSIKALANRRLEMSARMRLASDRRTANAGLEARAEDGVITVTYPPSRLEVAESIPKALEGLKGCKEVTYTMAAANILWIQERFDPESPAFRQIGEIARRWDAAIELARFTTASEDADDGGVSATTEALVAAGRSGGSWVVRGDSGALLSAVRGDVNYGLIAVGECFLSKPPEARSRMMRELAGHLTDRVSVPVVTTDELRKKYLVGPKQLLKMLLCSVAVSILYFLTFYYQDPILSFLGASEPLDLRIMRVVGVTLFVPLIAYLYSTVTSLFLKLLKFE